MDLESRIRDRAFQILKKQVSTGRGVVEPIELYEGSGGNFWQSAHDFFKETLPGYAPLSSLVGVGKKKKIVKKKTKKQPKKQPKKVKISDVQQIIEIEKIAPKPMQGCGLLDEIKKAANLLPLIGLGKKPKRKPSARNLLIKRVMKEKGLTLGQASKFISEHTK